MLVLVLIHFIVSSLNSYVEDITSKYAPGLKDPVWLSVLYKFCSRLRVNRLISFLFVYATIYVFMFYFYLI
jgi:hypothetical protein